MSLLPPETLIVSLLLPVTRVFVPPVSVIWSLPDPVLMLFTPFEALMVSLLFPVVSVLFPPLIVIWSFPDSVSMLFVPPLIVSWSLLAPELTVFVPPLGKDEGAIEFSLNGKNYYDVNSPKLTLQPEAGDIVFFPSSLHHRTIPFTTDEERIIISFDLMPKATRSQ